MSQQILKFTLERTDEQRILMPKFSKILSVGLQDGSIRMWAMGDPEYGMTHKTIRLVGTGYPLEHGFTEKYHLIGRVDDTPFIWHVYFLYPMFEVNL